MLWDRVYAEKRHDAWQGEARYGVVVKSGVFLGRYYFLFWKFKTGTQPADKLMVKIFPQYFLFW